MAALLSPRRATARLVANLVLLLVVIAFLAPLGWLIFGSIQSGAALTVSFHATFTMDNFAAIMNQDTLWLPMLNSLILSGGTALITVTAAALAAYPLSRYQSRFRKPFLYTLVFSTGLPITAIMVPVYAMFAHFNLTDSIPATILFMTATSLPFGIWMMKNFMDGVPVTLEEAAWTDGAGWFASLRRVVLPLMLPGLVVVGIFTFVVQWGDFFVPFILLLSPENQPASVSIYTFFGEFGQDAYGQLAAFSIMYTIPIVVLYLALSRFLGGSFAFAGGLKG